MKAAPAPPPMTVDDLPDYALPHEVASVSRRTENALALLRAQKPPRGPKFTKVDGRVLYRKTDVIAWLNGGDNDAAA